MAKTNAYKTHKADKAYLKPILWCQKGFQDMCLSPVISMILGLLLTCILQILGYISYKIGHLSILPCAMIFALIMPLFTLIFYSLSKAYQSGETSWLYSLMLHIKSYYIQSLGLSFTLILYLLFWMRIEGIIYTLFPHQPGLWLTYLPFFGLGILIGAVLLTIIFYLFAFTPQIVMDQSADIISACLTSAQCVHDNFKIMSLWAGFILTAVCLCILTLGVACIFIFPLLGYANWHAYQDMFHQKKLVLKPF